MKLPLGQLIKIVIDEREPPLLAVVTKKLDDAYELTWSSGHKMIKQIITCHDLLDEFSAGHYKLVID